MKKKIKKMIAGLMVCSIAGVFALNSNVDTTRTNITTGVVLATPSDATTEEGSGGVVPSGGTSRPGNSTTESNTTTERPTQATTEDNRTTEERPSEIVDAEEEIELEEARLTYPEQNLGKENGYFIYQVQAAKPYYRIFFTFKNGTPSADLLADGYMEAVHGADNVLRPSAAGADRLTYEDTNINKNYTFILDVSDSITGSAFDTAKEQIIEFIQGMKAGESFTLYTTSGSLPAYKLIDRISKAEGADIDESILSEIQNIEQETDPADLEVVRERVLQDRLEHNQDFRNDTPPDSLQILVEIINVRSAEEAQAADESNLSSEMFIIDINGNINGRLNELKSELANVFVVDLRGTSNRVDEEEQDLILYLYDDENEIKYAFEPYAIQVNKGIADNEPPIVEWIAFTQEENELWIQFSEPVFDADNIDHYQIVKKETAENIAVQSARIGNKTGNVYILKLADIGTSGEYEVTITGSVESGTISDRSAEQNGLVDYTDTFTVKIIEQIEPVTDEETKDSSWWEIVLIIVVVLLLIAAIVVIIMRKKGKSTTKTPQKKPLLETVSSNKEDEHAASKAGSALGEDAITLLIQRDGITLQELHKNVGEGLIIGRAEVSDVVVDEVGMASEHFVIEYDDEDFYVQDLETLMGTSLNGVKMKHKRRLESDDRISVGELDIVVKW